MTALFKVKAQGFCFKPLPKFKKKKIRTANGVGTKDHMDHLSCKFKLATFH